MLINKHVKHTNKDVVSPASKDEGGGIKFVSRFRKNSGPAEGERVSPGGLGVRLNLTEHGEKSVREGCQGANSAHNGPPKSLMKEVQVAAHDGKGDRNTRDENGARLGRSSVPHSLAQGSAPGTRSGVNVAGDNNNREGVVGYSAEQPSALRENIQSRDFRSPSGYLGGDKRTSKPGLHKNRETKGSDVTGCLRSGILTSRKYEPGALAHYLDSRKKKAEIHSKDVVKAKDTREGGFIPPPGQGMQQGPPDRPCKTHMIGTGNASGMKIDIKTTGACDMPTIPLCSSQAPVPSIRSSSLKSAHPSMGDTKHTAQFSHIMKTINDGNLSAFLPKDTGACADSTARGKANDSNHSKFGYPSPLEAGFVRHSEHKPKGGDSANGGPKETENTALGGEWTPGTGASDCHDSPIAIIPPIADQANNKVLETSPDSEKGTLMPRPDTRSPSPLKWGACAQAESLGPTGFAPEDPSRGQLQESRAEPERPGLHAAGLLSGIKNLNIKKILKNINKVDEGSAGVRRTCTPRKKAADDEIERLSAITSIIDYMDLGHENPEKVMEKLEELTKVARGYLFIMVRRGWIEVYHVIDETEASPEGRLRLWRDREFSCHIEIETVTLSKLSSVIDQRGLARGALPLKAKLRADPRASVVHLYEYNEKANKHYLRKLAIVPAALPEEVSEPPPLDPSEVSQDNPRRQIILDEWRRSAAAHQNSDFYQLNVLCDKAERLDRDIRSAYDNLLSALPSFSRASSSIHRDFSHLPTARLKEVVGRIPLVIGKFLDQVREQTGLVVSRSDVKLTSSFFEYLHSDAEPSLLMSASKSGRPAASNNDFGSQGLGLEYPTPLGINPCLCGTYYVLTNRRKSV